MKFKLFLLSALLLQLYSFGQTSEPAALSFTYTLKPRLQGQHKAFGVCLSFNSGPRADTRLEVPQVWGGSSAWKFLVLDSVHGVQAYIVAASDSSEIRLSHPAGANIRVYYTIRDAARDSLQGNGETYTPIIKEKFFYMFANSVFLVLKDPGKHRFRIGWSEYPAAWKTAPVTSFGNGMLQELNSSTVSGFQDAILLGGDYKLYTQTNDRKQKLYVAIRGCWAFQDSAMVKLISETIVQQRKFWNDYSSPAFLVSITPGQYQSEDEQSFTGTGLYNSFTVLALCNKRSTPASLTYLFHHELMHHWIGSTIQNATNEEASYWFSEGFTDYFARLNMRNSKHISERQYNALLDSILAIHYSSPVGTMPNDSIKAHFWNDRAYEKLPYNRGSLFAWYLDYYIQKHTAGKASLKTVMQRMLKTALAEPRNFELAWFCREVQQVCGKDIRPLIQTYIMEGTYIPLTAWNAVLPSPLVQKYKRINGIGLHFDTPDIEKGSLVTAVDKDSGAELAGIKVGDKVRGFSFYGSWHERSELNVERNGEKLSIPFNAYIEANVLQRKP